MPESNVPIVCTLHPNEWGGRLDEWHRLFAAHLSGIQRPSPPGCGCSCPPKPALGGCRTWRPARWSAAPS